MTPHTTVTSRRLLWAAVIILGVLHHDFWWWGDRTIVLGIMPVGLFYHMLYSVAAAAIWALAIRYAWPNEIEEWAGECEPAPQKAASETRASGGSRP